jgi:hypothetical protein
MPQDTVEPSTLEDLAIFLKGLGSSVTDLELIRPGAPRRILAWKRADYDSPEELASAILSVASVDAKGRLVPMVFYDLNAWGPQSDPKGDGHHMLRVRGAAKVAGADIDTPDMGQAFVHVLRENSNLVRLLVASRDTTQDQLLRQLEYQGKQLEANDGRRVELYRLMEDLGNTKLQREIEAQQAKLIEKRQEMVAQKIDYYLPVAFNRLLGGGPGTGKIPMAEQLLDTLLGNMTQAQIEALAKGEPVALSEEQRLVFAELYTAAAAKHAARQARTIDPTSNATTNGAGNGHANGGAGA